MALPNAFGLINVGSSCYFNAVIQGLVSCSNFTVNILNSDIDDDNIMLSYLELISSKNKNPRKLLDMVKPSRTQEDAHEYLLRIIDSFSKQFNKIFEFNIEEIIICNSCEKISTKTLVDNYYFMDNFSKDYFKKTNEKLTDFICDCKSKNVEINKRIISIPKVMIIVLNRYNNQSKTYPLNFRLGEHEYELVATISSNNGNVNSGGHYWCVAKRNNGIFRLNDISITELNEYPINDNSAYVLFYNLVIE